jgi:energy-coupling factor transporter transmembrane protein EcfT
MARWLEYESRDTFLHKRLHPLTKMVVVAGIVVASGMWLDPRYQAVLFLLAIVPIYVSKIPLYWFSVVALAVVTSIYPVAATSLGQTNVGLYKVLDPTWAATPLVGADIPFVGKLGVTRGGLLWLLNAELRSSIMAIYMFVFIYTTSMAEVTDTLLALKVPQPAVFVISIAYKLIPHFSRVVEHILSAQRLRGWSLRHWNPVMIVRRAAPLMKPLMRRVAIMTEQITMATQIRGFGSGKVTATRHLNPTKLDYALMVIAALATVTVVILTIFFDVGQL